MNKISIILPTYNEKDNIIILVNRISKILKNYKNKEIIIVDDSSSDNTFGVAKKKIADDESFSEQVEEYLNELAEFSLSRKISLLSLNLVEKKCFHYDFISFMAKNFTGDPTLYYRPEKQNIMIGHSDSQRDLIENYLEIFGDSYYGFANMLNFQGVSKFFREARLLPQ